MGKRLSKIYTRTGDDGTTGLGDGSRVAKDSLRVEAFGTVDEANSAIGVVLAVDAVPQGIRELLTDGYIPSFCTACYRLGRTGQQFMEFAIPGFIEQFCTPNALTTLQEYLVDYASPATRKVGEALIRQQLETMSDSPRKSELLQRLNEIYDTQRRDLYW